MYLKYIYYTVKALITVVHPTPCEFKIFSTAVCTDVSAKINIVLSTAVYVYTRLYDIQSCVHYSTKYFEPAQCMRSHMHARIVLICVYSAIRFRIILLHAQQKDDEVTHEARAS